MHQSKIKWFCCFDDLWLITWLINWMISWLIDWLIVLNHLFVVQLFENILDQFISERFMIFLGPLCRDWSQHASKYLASYPSMVSKGRQIPDLQLLWIIQKVQTFDFICKICFIPYLVFHFCVRYQIKTLSELKIYSLFVYNIYQFNLLFLLSIFHLLLTPFLK